MALHKLLIFLMSIYLSTLHSIAQAETDFFATGLDVGREAAKIGGHYKLSIEYSAIVLSAADPLNAIEAIERGYITPKATPGQVAYHLGKLVGFSESGGSLTGGAL